MPHIVTRPGWVAGSSLAVLLALVHAVNDALTAVLGALLPTLEARLAASATTLSLLVAAFNISSSITQPILGALADRLGLRRVAALGVGLSAVSFSLVGPATTVTVVLVLLVLGGLGSAALHPVSTSIVGGPTARNAGLAVGLFTAAGMAGFAAGPAVILYVVARFGPDATSWLMIPGVTLAIALFVLLPDWEPHAAGRLIQTRVPAPSTPVVLLTAAATLVSLVFITFSSTIPRWLVREYGVATDAPLLGLTLGAFSLAAALGAVVGGALNARLGSAVISAGSMLLAVAPLSAILLVPPSTATVAIAAAAGATLYASQPLLIVAAQTSATGSPTAAAGLVMGLGNALAGLLYIGSGVLQDLFGLAPVMGLSFALLVPAALLAWLGMSSGRESPALAPAAR